MLHLRKFQQHFPPTSNYLFQCHTQKPEEQFALISKLCQQHVEPTQPYLNSKGCESKLMAKIFLNDRYSRSVCQLTYILHLNMILTKLSSRKHHIFQRPYLSHLNPNHIAQPHITTFTHHTSQTTYHSSSQWNPQLGGMVTCIDIAIDNHLVTISCTDDHSMGYRARAQRTRCYWVGNGASCVLCYDLSRGSI